MLKDKAKSIILPVLAVAVLLAGAFYINYEEEKPEETENQDIGFQETTLDSDTNTSTPSADTVTSAPTDPPQFSVSGVGGDGEESERHEGFEDD